MIIVLLPLAQAVTPSLVSHSSGLGFKIYWINLNWGQKVIVDAEVLI
jgi:hypothetical protein